MARILNGIRLHIRRSRLGWMGLGLGAIALVLLIFPARAIDPGALPASQYSSTVTAPFNQPSYFPVKQASPSPLYRPTAPWTGRLILPTVAQYQQFANTTKETDWAWLQIYTAPAADQKLVGQTVRLAWADLPQVQQYVRVTSRDVRFTERAKSNFQSGTINPIRLDGRNQVGPIQSLAGGLPHDVMTVQLRGQVQVEQTPATAPPAEGTKPPAKPTLTITPTVPNSEGVKAGAIAINPNVTLRVDREPFQDTGRFEALVKFMEPVAPTPPATLPEDCPGAAPCASELMRVRHYNPKTKQFDGATEVIRIPQQPADVGGVFSMTTRELAQSPAGAAGWYIYGAKAQDGRFTVEALRPRSLFQIPPQEVILGFNQGLSYIRRGNWADLEQRQGTLQTVLADPVAPTVEAAKQAWQVGDRALLLHLYGGRGGTHDRHESYILGTYAGHFSFGVGTVITDPFTQEPIWDVDYLQVFGNGSDGTLSGGQTWTHYMGNLRRGFMGTRPVADTLVELDTLTAEYDFGGTKLSFFNELVAQLSLVGARYRIGDGSGNSTITSATSCVQDSAQAIFHTLVRFRQKVETNPEIVQWMRDNPTHPTTERFTKMVALAQDMARQLTPMGVVRWDWQQNAEVLTGIEPQQKFLSIDDFRPRNLLTGLISWRTAMPRQANDEFAMLFLHHDAKLWFQRTNIIGGQDPGLAPLEATLLLGAWRLPFTQIPLLSYLVIRTFGGVTIPSWGDWLTTLGILIGFGAIALGIGFSQGILQWHPWAAPWYRQVGAALRLAIVPALVQEYIFRVLLIPYPKSWIPVWYWWAWGLLSVVLFVGWQWVHAKYLQRSRLALIANPPCLLLTTLLGLACTLTYWLTGSLWTITLIHWVFVAAWWLLLGGKQQMLRSKNKYAKYV